MCCQINCLHSASFQISFERGMNALKGESDSFQGPLSRLFVALSVSWLRPTQNSCRLKRVYFLCAGQGWNLLRGRTESKFHIEPHCPARRIRSIYLTCSLSTCFAAGEDPMESLIERRNEKAVFLSFSPHFFLLQWCSRCRGEPWAQRGWAKAP